MTEIIKLTEIEINQTIHRAIGKCWHEVVKDAPRQSLCVRCHRPVSVTHVKRVGVDTDWVIRISENPSYTSNWSDYGQALEWAMKQDWWDDFGEFIWDRLHNATGFLSYLLNPLRGSTALAEFIKEKGL